MKERIFKEKITSIIGVLIIIAAFVFLWFEKVDVTGCVTLVGVGFAGILSKDKWFKPSDAATLILFILFSILFYFSLN